MAGVAKGEYRGLAYRNDAELQAWLARRPKEAALEAGDPPQEHLANLRQLDREIVANPVNLDGIFERHRGKLNEEFGDLPYLTIHDWIHDDVVPAIDLGITTQFPIGYTREEFLSRHP
jgi:hypothetical protein